MAQITRVKTVSTFLSIGIQDAVKGFVTAVITALLAAVYKLVEDGADFTTKDWRTIGLSALGAGVAYLLKNLFSGPVQTPKADTDNP